MQACRTELPAVPLTIGDARLRQPGGVLLAEAATIAFGGDAASLPDLHDTWTRYGSFAYRYIDRMTVTFSISSEAEEAIKEASPPRGCAANDRAGNFLGHWDRLKSVG